MPYELLGGHWVPREGWLPPLPLDPVPSPFDSERADNLFWIRPRKPLPAQPRLLGWKSDVLGCTLRLHGQDWRPLGLRATEVRRGIRFGAERRDGPHGDGVVLHAAAWPRPASTRLHHLVRDADVRRLVLSRYAWVTGTVPALTSTELRLVDEQPALLLTAAGASKDLGGVPRRGITSALVTLRGGHAHVVRAHHWTSNGRTAAAHAALRALLLDAWRLHDTTVVNRPVPGGSEPIARDDPRNGWMTEK